MDPESVAVCNTPRAGKGGTFQLVVDKTFKAFAFGVVLPKVIASRVSLCLTSTRECCVFSNRCMRKLVRFHRNLKRFSTHSNALQEKPKTKNLGVKKENNDGPLVFLAYASSLRDDL